MSIEAYLIDGTYELFRHYFAVPSARGRDGLEVGGLVGVLGSVLGMLEEGVTHLGVATDHVIESFRNDLWPGYKSGEGIDPDLWNQFHPLEDALGSMGIVVWPMTDLEADDAMASAARLADSSPLVSRVFICTPDKDLSQCVVGDRVVQMDRRKREIRNEEGVIAKFGVGPRSIPDYLALVGDSADGFPGIPGWGAKSSATVLARYGTIEAIPDDANQWDVTVRGARRLAEALATNREAAALFKILATLRTDAPLFDDVEELRWAGPHPSFQGFAAQLNSPGLYARATRAAGA